MLLSDPQVVALGRLFGRLVVESSWRRPRVGESEPHFTRDVILPTVRTWLPTLQKPSLFLRADGGVAPLPVAGHGVFFYPDIEIAAHSERYLAVEVKFVRDQDPSGSISKALGQALVYRAAGIPQAHVVLIECRTGARGQGDIEGVFASLPREFGIFSHYVVPIRDREEGPD